MSARRDATCIPSTGRTCLMCSRNNEEARVAGVELQREEMGDGSWGTNQIGKKAEGKFCKAL